MFNPQQYACNFLFAELSHKRISYLHQSLPTQDLELKFLQRMLVLIQRPVLRTERIDFLVPRLVWSSFLQSVPQTNEKIGKVRGLYREARTVFRGVFDIVEILDHFGCELQDSNNARRNAERVYVISICCDRKEDLK